MINDMVRAVKRGIVIALEDACELTGHHFCNSLAATSERLDRRWNTGVWSTVGEIDPK